jgi:hypothetical protein
MYGHVNRRGDTRSAYRMLQGKLLGNVHLEDREGK